MFEVKYLLLFLAFIIFLFPWEISDMIASQVPALVTHIIIHHSQLLLKFIYDYPTEDTS